MPPKTRTRKQDNFLKDPVTEEDREKRLALVSERAFFLLLKEATTPPTMWSFVDFASRFLNLKLTPAQKAAASFLFDAQAPDPAYADSVFGGYILPPPREAKNTAMAVCGRGSGKSLVFVAARALHLALIADLSSLQPGEPALVALVAPAEKQGIVPLNFVKGFFKANPLLARILKYEETKLRVTITRPDGVQVYIEVRHASAGGDSVRGPSLAGVFMDEAAFFYGEGYEINDTEIWRAAMPRLAMIPRSQMVITTTPWGQEGLVWEMFKNNYGKPTSAAVVRAPTLVMRSDRYEELKIEYDKLQAVDSDNAAREWDAQFLSSDAERFFTEAHIAKAIDETLILPGVVKNGETVRFGADFAFASDSSALVSFAERDKLEVVSLIEKRPLPDEPLKPSEVVDEFAREIQRCGAKLVVADAHYREAIQEHLTQYGLALIDAPTPPAASFVVARTLMAQGRLRIPNHPRLVAQLRRVKSTIKPGGVITIHQPRAKEGGHGDIVSALVCALSGVSVDAYYPKPPPKTRSEAEIEAEAKARVDKLRANGDRLAKDAKKMVNSWRRTLGNKVWKNLTR